MSAQVKRKQRRRSFGVAIPDSKSLPPVVLSLVEYFDNKGCDDEGIFRISAKIDDVEKLRKSFEKNEPENVNLASENVHVLANLLKLYFRELPEPLFTFQAYHDFVNIAKLPEDQRIPKLQLLLPNLPFSNRILIKYLIKFLSRVTLRKRVNKMSANNLAIVFAPSILRPSDPLLVLGGSSDATLIVETMISNCDQIFEQEPDHENKNLVVVSSWKGYEIDLVKLESELQLLNKPEMPKPIFPAKDKLRPVGAVALAPVAASRNTSEPLIKPYKSFIDPSGYCPTENVAPKQIVRRSNGKVIGTNAGPRRFSQPVDDRKKVKVLPGPLLSSDNNRLSTSLPKFDAMKHTGRKQKPPKLTESSSSTDG